MKRLLFVVMGCVLSACVVGPDYQRPVVETPKQWSKPTADAAQSKDFEYWWHTFNDAMLNQLIVDASHSNLDLKQALERIKAARAQRTTTIAAGLPSFTSKGNVNRRFNSSASTSALNSSAVQSGGFGSQLINLLQFGVDAQWELDFFGGVQRAVEAAEATLDSEIENRHDVLVSLFAEVARNYIELRSNQQLIAITQRHLENQQQTLELLKVRQQAGLADMSEIAQAQAELASIQAQFPSEQMAIQQAIHALSLLLGKQPNALAARLQPVAHIPVVKSNVLPDLPSTLLQRRPDIRYAERQLAFANAQVGIATSELYPKFNLSAFLGLQNTKITDFTLLGKSWSAGSSLTMPLFNWGKINANIKGKEAQYQQALFSYQKTVLTAFKEVEDALVAYDQEQQKQKSLQQAVTANQQAVELANERYKKGLTSFLNVLTSQQALQQAQTSLVASTAKTSANLILLYKVLGGGWQAF